MARSLSPLPADTSLKNQELSDKLDEDIARVRAEIESVTKRKHLLTSSLLSSTNIQSQLSARSISQPAVSLPDLTPLQSQAQYNETNIHRLAYGVTSFPYTDPSPDTSDRPLLGIRFDMPSRNGKYDKAPYYIFLKPRGEDDSDTAVQQETSSNHILKIHHHTIPALVPLQDYEARYLPRSGVEASGHGRNTNGGSLSPAESTENDNESNDVSAQRGSDIADKDYPAQNLHALVTAVRRDLTSWQLRNDAILLLAEQLGLSEQEDGEGGSAKVSLRSLQATAADARFARLVWRNGTVGRLRLTDDGYIDRAVVIGDAGNAMMPNRLRDIERILGTGKNGRRLQMSDLIERLQEAETRMNKVTEPRTAMSIDGNDEDSMQIDVEE